MAGGGPSGKSRTEWQEEGRMAGGGPSSKSRTEWQEEERAREEDQAAEGGPSGRRSNKVRDRTVPGLFRLSNQGEHGP